MVDVRLFRKNYSYRIRGILKNFIFFLWGIFFFLVSRELEARVFFVGSNHHYSFIAFPQDVLKFRSNFISYSLQYQNLPWWGDVDEFQKKPTNDYSTSFESFTFARNTADTNDNQASTFEKDGYSRNFKHRVSWLKKIDKSSTFLLSLQIKHLHLHSYAKGNAKVKDDDGNVTHFIPFDYESSTTGQNIYAQGIYSTKINRLPVGVKLGFGWEAIQQPKTKFTANINGREIESERLLWGWSTVGCNHIFVDHHTNADAWYENNYSVGRIYQFDIQGGITLKKAKIGSRYRHRWGLRDNYQWYSIIDADETSSFYDQITNHFIGSYQKEKWSSKLNEHIFRVYSNISWKKWNKIELKTLFFLGYMKNTQENVSSANIDFSNNVKEQFSDHLIETNPNLSFQVSRFLVIDAAILMEFSYTGFKNTYERYNSSMQGTKETYWNTSVYVGGERDWENFSYAKNYFIDYGWDLNVRFMMFHTRKRSLFISLFLMHNNKHTWGTQYFGSNQNTSSDVVFTVENKRKNISNEMWLNSAISVFYKSKRYFYRITYVEPLIYNIEHSTKVTDSNNNTLYYEKQNFQTAIQATSSVSHPSVTTSSMVTFMIGYNY